jgi:hypothetical protein
MKTENEIRALITSLKVLKKDADKRHSELDQISMLSGEGSSLRAKSNNLEGQIEALKWVLNEH